MKPIYINLDINGQRKQSDIIAISSSTPQILYYRLYRDKYEIDYSTLLEFRLIFEDIETTDVYTASSTMIETVNDIKYIKLEIASSVVTGDKNYIVRPVIKTTDTNKGLIKFKFMVRSESTADISNLTSMIDSVNNIYSIYLNSIKRQEIGAPNGVVSLDENGKILEANTPQDILDHINLKLEGHGLRLDKDYYIEYLDTQDNIYYRLNLLEGGKFGVPHKDKTYSYDRGIW